MWLGVCVFVRVGRIQQGAIILTKALIHLRCEEQLRGCGIQNV